MGKTVRIMKFGLLGPLVLLGCAMETSEGASTTAQELAGDAFTNPTGRHRTVTVDGTQINEQNAFFQSLGTNGRACVHCHQPSAAMTITPPQVQAVFNATQGFDPVFRLNDGANGPTAPVATLAQRSAAYSLLRTKGLIRIPINLPASRDFDVRVVLNPYAWAGANPPQNASVPPNQGVELSFYRRPLLSANTRFISAVMWDGREATVNPVPANAGAGDGVQANEPTAPVFINMLTQSNNATLGHAEGVNPLTAAQRNEIVSFQMNLVTAQEFDNASGPTNAEGALGGPQALRTQQSFFGINDSHGGNPFGTGFNRVAMTVFDAWANSSNARRRSINRGQAIFNTRTIRISGVRGVNDALGVATLNGTCTTCHSHPNVGNHTDILPLDLGISDVAEGDNVLPVFRVTPRPGVCASTSIFGVPCRSVEVTDLGRAALTGRFADLGKQKGPTLRALSARAPYFHNGAADNLDEVVDFYDRRFHIGFTSQERADLKAFLEAL